MNINRRDTLKLFGFAAISPLSFLHQNKDIVWGPVEDYKELSKYWKLKTSITPPTNYKNCPRIRFVNFPGTYQIKASYIEQNKTNENLVWICEYDWELFFSKDEEKRIKIFDYDINLIYKLDIARDLSYCCHNMYGCMGKQCDCKTKFFKENKHWADYEHRFYTSEYSLKWLGFKNNLRMTSMNYRTESKKDSIIL